MSNLLRTLLAAFIAAALAWTLASNEPLPTCPEDAVLIGHGQFDNGRWDSYHCGPSVDDYIGH